MRHSVGGVEDYTNKLLKNEEVARMASPAVVASVK